MNLQDRPRKTIIKEMDKLMNLEQPEMLNCYSGGIIGGGLACTITACVGKGDLHYIALMEKTHEDKGCE